MALQVAIASRSEEFEAARAHLEDYINDNPANRDAIMLFGDVEMAAANPAAAAERYESAARLEWDRAIAMRLSNAYLIASPHRASQPLARWLENNTDDAEVRRVYGQILESQGQIDKAVAQYETVLQTHNNDPVALNNLAWQYAELGRKEAVQLARRAHQLAPDNGSITDTYAWILFQQGESKQALSLLRQAVQLSPDNPQIRYHLAVVHADVGDLAEAKAILGVLLQRGEQFPSRTDAEALMEEL
jgi:tetratricopeptide (TPR) repeat protein